MKKIFFCLALTAVFCLSTNAQKAVRNVLVEEMTGTGCGWCPRGMVGLENAKKAYGNRVVCIALHMFNSSDAMYTTTDWEPNLLSGGAPSCVVDRKSGEIDPYYDLPSKVKSYVSASTNAEIVAVGEYNEDKTAVDIDVNVKYFSNSGDYKVLLVLTADGLSGTGSAWLQSNYYSSDYSSSTGINETNIPSDLYDLLYKGSTFKAVFDDVMIASSYKSGKTQVPALQGTRATGETMTTSYTLKLPTKATLKKALNYDKINIVSILLNSSGKVVNCNSVPVGVIPTGIEKTVLTTKTNATEVARYNVNGQRITAPTKGVNIVKYSDGTTRKELHK